MAEGPGPVCATCDPSDVVPALQVAQGDIIIGKRVAGTVPMLKTDHFKAQQPRYIPMEQDGRTLLKSLGKAPGRDGKAYQLMSLALTPASRWLDVRCTHREEAVPRLLRLRADSNVMFDCWQAALQEHLRFANEICTDAEFRVRKLAFELSKRTQVLSVLKAKLFDNNAKEIMIKCVLRWGMKASSASQVQQLQHESRKYKAKLHEASSAAAELITKYQAGLGLVPNPQGGIARVQLNDFCHGFSLTPSPLIVQVFESFDESGDGFVNYTDFSRLLEEYSVLDYDGRVAWIFRLWDSEHQGRLTPQQVRRALKSAAASDAALQSIYRKVEHEFSSQVVPGATMAEYGVDLHAFKVLCQKFGTVLVYPSASVMDCVIAHTYSDPDNVTRGFMGAWRQQALDIARHKTETLVQGRSETLSGCVGLGWFFD